MKGKVGKIVKRILLSLLLVISVLTLFYWDLVVYGIRQAKGQLNIVWNARPVEEFMMDPDFPDSLKDRLNFINEVRRFAIDSLALKDTKNYKTLYDQKGEEIMWVVTACEPFQLKAKEWKFPVLGSVPYKGFFDKKLAVELAENLKREGFDVSIRNPGGWSTLGWFTDPILSKMLERGEGDLANLIIHEMSHATIFVKDSIDFNENLATFIGDRGTEKFLISRFGKSSKEYQSYMNDDADFLKFSEHMLRGTEKLDSLYKSMNPQDSVSRKKELKTALIRKIVDSLDTLTLSTTESRPSERYKDHLPNNTYFMNFRRYQSKQELFWDEYRNRFHGDLKSFIEFMSEKYPFL
jgi:predicted aminopeptidase